MTSIMRRLNEQVQRFPKVSSNGSCRWPNHVVNRTAIGGAPSSRLCGRLPLTLGPIRCIARWSSVHFHSVSPTVLRAKGFRLFFFSREELRMHVHAQSARGEAKFWLDPQIELAQSYGLPQVDVNEALRLIRENEDVIRRAWNDHFGR